AAQQGGDNHKMMAVGTWFTAVLTALALSDVLHVVLWIFVRNASMAAWQCARDSVTCNGEQPQDQQSSMRACTSKRAHHVRCIAAGNNRASDNCKQMRDSASERTTRA
ncbi:hypothetical protein Dimus_020678, partial [Dionaea muscipula]